LIVVHIGSEEGFVEGGQYIFQSKSTKDYHEELDGQRFAAWLENVLPLLEENSVIVIDNAPYHSFKAEKSPNTSWNKGKINEWLQRKGVETDLALLKIELLDLIKGYLAKKPIPYVIDRMVQETGRQVLRLPPYH
jgi:hypothetical protein